MSSTSETFTVRWGKLSLALLGVVAIVAVPVTLVLALTVGASLWATLIAVAVAVFSVAGLRASAVQDRRKKAWKQAAASVPAALIESAAQAAQAEAKATETAAEKDAKPPVAEASAPAEPVAVVTVQDQPFDMMAQDEAAEEVEQTPAAQAPVAAAETPAEQESEGWEPREVPAPKYVGATPAQRPAPEPLPSEEAKRAEVITSIRRAEAQRAEEEDAKRAERLNLDAVLQRRRA